MSSYSRPTGPPESNTDNVQSIENATLFSSSLDNTTVIAELQTETTIDNLTLYLSPDHSAVESTESITLQVSDTVI